MAAVDAEVCVRRAVRRLLPDLGAAGRRWHVLAAGKAAVPMLRAALESAGAPPASALCVAPQPDDRLPLFVEVCLGGHPIPTAGSVEAGSRALAMAAGCEDDDQWLVLLSGGASALLAAPVAGITLADKQATTARLLRSGADIYALNTVRKHLSNTKGGRLAAASRAQTTCVAISDVVGDDLSVIASGPTVPDPSTFADALAVLDRNGGRKAYPPRVVTWLEDGARTGWAESPKPGAVALARTTTHVIASRQDALKGAADEAGRRGYVVTVWPDPIVGEAREAGLAHESVVAAACASGGRAPQCVLSAGETTVTVTGAGSGGRNQELALASVLWLAHLHRDTALVSVGTDGIDGPTDAAGALADSSSLHRARAAGLGLPEEFLAQNDSYRYFACLGDLVMTGPSGTNVGDVQIVVVGTDSCDP